VIVLEGNENSSDLAKVTNVIFSADLQVHVGSDFASMRSAKQTMIGHEDQVSGPPAVFR